MQHSDLQKVIAHMRRNKRPLKADTRNAGPRRNPILGTDEYRGFEFWGLVGVPFALTKGTVQQALQKVEWKTTVDKSWVRTGQRNECACSITRAPRSLLKMLGNVITIRKVGKTARTRLAKEASTKSNEARARARATV